MAGRDEFYVGYADRAPDGLARFTKRVVILLALVVPLATAWIASAQNPLPEGTFEFNVSRDYEGVLFETPFPVLRSEGMPMLLVGLGKQGLPDFARGHHGSRVRFSGSLIHRQGVAMVEMNDPESFEVLGAAPPGEGNVEVLGPVELVGELVDTKCYLGVMRPATGKVHRACAVRCLKGGIPPGLLVREIGGRDTVLVLRGAEIDPEWAGRLMSAAGSLELHDGLPVLRVERVQLQ